MEENLEKIYGADGIEVSSYLGATNDLSSYQIKISGSQINSQFSLQINAREISN